MTETNYTYRSLLNKGTQLLEAHDVTEAGTDAWLLLAGTAGISRTEYLMRSSDKADDVVVKDYFDKLDRRCKGEPVQYIEGKTPFMGFEFKVNKNVLIPRFDTEVLVEQTLKQIKSYHNENEIKVLDMCTGSGCIIESIYLLAKEKGIKLEAAAADISEGALEVAKENAVRLGAEISFIKSDLFEKVTDSYDIIVSNPPYIRTSVVDTLEDTVKNYEPRLALDGYEDGLFFYRKIIDESQKHLRAGGIILFEIGYDQAAEVSRELFDKGFDNIKVIKDLAGLDRVVTAQRKI